MQTVAASPEDISEGIQAGAYYYLIKPFDKELLFSVIKTATHDYSTVKEIQQTLKQTKHSIGLLNSATFEFRTLDQARPLASLISNTCPEPESIVLGLTELMVNAIEHGNLEITYDEKSYLNEQGTWLEEVSRRLALTKNLNKTVQLSFIRQNDKIEITISDQGNGFNWEDYMDFSPNRAMDNHGRGIAMANKLSFSKIEYQGNGNSLIATVFLNE